MDMIFNMHKIRYVDMHKLTSEMDRGSVQIFINLETVLRKLQRADVESYLKANYKKRIYEFVSNILNLAAHYRKFFSNQGRATEVIIYMPDWRRSYTNAMLIKGYREDSDAKLFNEKTVYGRFLKESIDLIMTIVKYIEGVHLVKSNVIEPSLIPFVLKNHMSNHVLITTDKYEYQYASHGFTILRPRKNYESYMINKDNVIDVMKFEDKIVSSEMMNHNFIPLALSFMGDSLRGIPKIKGVGLYKVIQMVDKGVKEGIITEQTTNLSILEDIIVEDIREHIRNNFMTIDLTTQNFNVTRSTKLLLEEQMEDKFDNVSLKKLNQLFIESPIMLNELMPLKEKKSVFES